MSFISVFVFLLGFLALAQNPKYDVKFSEDPSAGGRSSFDDRDVRLCEDLTPAICQEMRLNDSTGGAKTRADANKSINKKMKALLEKNQEYFAKLLRDPNEGYLRELLYSSTVPSEECKSADDLKSKDICVSIYSGRLSDSEFARASGMEPSQEKFIKNASGFWILQSQVKVAQQAQKLREEIANVGHDQAFEKKVENQIFPKVKDLLLARVQRSPIADDIKNLILKKIQGIQFGGFDCTQTADYLTERSAINQAILPNAIYLADKNSIFVCRGVTYNLQSELAMVSLIAHELSHSLDPCFLTIDPVFREKLKVRSFQSDQVQKIDQNSPLSELLSCLRSPKSIAPKRKMKKRLATDTCRNFPGEFDQINEAVPDWFAAEVLADYLSSQKPALSSSDARIGIAHFGRIFQFHSQFCELNPKDFREWTKTSTHPHPADRINRIFLVQPELRKSMGCPVKAQHASYCSFEMPKGTAQKPGNVNSQGSQK